MNNIEAFTGSNDRPKTDAAAATEGTLPDISTSDVFPCSYTQLRIWYTQQLDPDSSHWNVAMRWRLEGQLRDATVERAWQMLVDRHEALRTGIDVIDGVPHQRVWSRWPTKIGIIDLSRLPEAQRLAAADEIAQNDAVKLVPISPAPPFRLQLIRMSDDTAFLLTNFHNVIVDGWSVGVLLREFGEIASSLEAGSEPQLPPPSMQHVDYTLWQSDMLASGSFDADRAYWTSLLSNWSRFEVPSDKPRAPVLTHEGDIRTLLLPRGLSDGLNEYSRAKGVSMFHIGMATLTACLANRTGNKDVFIGTQTACRDEPELDTLVGPLINTAALRFDASGDPALHDLLMHCRKRCNEGMEHQHLPFNFVAEALKPKRDPSRNLIYSITCAVQTAHIDTGRIDDLRFDGLKIAAMPSFSAGAPTDLGFFMVGREEGWRLSCAGNTDLYEIETIDALLDAWAKTVEALVEKGGTARLSELDRLDLRTYRASGINGARHAPIHRSDVDKQKDVGHPVEPLDATQAKISEIWRDVLGTSRIDQKTDFFDAGGTSLSALQMLSRVNKTLGQKVSLTTLLCAPRLGEFSAQYAKTELPQVVSTKTPAIKFTQTRNEHISVQPVLALNNGYAYLQLKRPLGEAFPLIDIPVGTTSDTEFAKDHSFEEITARVVQRIVAAQPEGPYVIMAYCVLGLVALEVARQLEAQGRSVRLIAAINASAPYYYEAFSTKARVLRRASHAREIVENFGVLVRMFRAGEISFVTLLEHYGFVRKSGVLSLLRRLKLIAAAPENPELVEAFLFTQRMREAFDRAPRHQDKVRCDVVVYRTTDILKGPAFPPALGWPTWVSGQVHVCDVSGKHIDVLKDPAASEVARHLSSVMTMSDADVKASVSV